jgi:hypothetical protein
MGIPKIKGVFYMPRNKLVVQNSQSLVNQFKEEMAEEFGIYRPAVETEAVTPKILKQHKNDKNK